ncbi:MAG: YcxB family protein [Candidatus Eisenbacteria bacterium]|nr:YcxB family protein [Candidatus Eisenbacteria bacterium]
MPTFTFDQQQDDVCDATRAMISIQPGARVAGAMLLLLPLLGLVSALMLHWKAGAAVRTLLPVAVGAWGMLFVGRPLSCWWMARSAQRAAEAAGPRRTVIVDDAGVELQTPGGSGRLRWNEVARVDETRRLFLFHVSPGRAVMLPKRVMSETEAEGIRGIVRQRTSG